MRRFRGNNRGVVARTGLSCSGADPPPHATLREVPEELRRFKEHVRDLNVRSRALKALPEWLCELRNLQKLDLSYCSGLTALPESMGRLTGLRSLDLSYMRDCGFGLTHFADGILVHNIKIFIKTWHTNRTGTNTLEVTVDWAHYNVQPESTLHLVLRLEGGCIAAPIPSTFGLHPNTPGVTYLHSPPALAAAGQSEAAHLVQQLGGDPAARPWSRPDRVLLAPEQRHTLISLLDDTHSSAAGKNEDVQVTVTADRLEGLLGAETVR